ncbi:hypothetical protein D9M68_565200 [compost metagenome]
MPGGLADHDDRRGPSRAVRPDHRRRRPAVVLGRLARHEPHALCRRPAGRQLAHRADQRPGQRQVRRSLAGTELRKPESGEYALVQAVQLVLQGGYRVRALPELREMVGRPRLPERPRNPVHRRQSLRRQPPRNRRPRDVRRHPHRPAQHSFAHRGVLLQGRQHHASAAGAGLDSRPVPGRSRSAGPRPDHRLRRARKHRPPGHLCVRQRGPQGTPGVHVQHRHDRCAAAGHLPGRDRRQDARYAERGPGLRQLRAVVRAAQSGRRARHRGPQGRGRPPLCRRRPDLRHQPGHVPQFHAALGARHGDAAIRGMGPAPASAAPAL